MRNMQSKLYGIGAPLLLLPLMDMSISQVPDYFRGTEFVSFITEVIIQLVTGVMDAFIAVLLGGLLGQQTLKQLLQARQPARQSGRLRRTAKRMRVCRIFRDQCQDRAEHSRVPGGGREGTGSGRQH